MTLFSLWEWLEHVPFVAAVNDDLVLSASILCAHVLGLALTFGATIVTAVRLFAVTPPSSRALHPSVRLSVLGFVAAAGSGFLLFAHDASDYAADSAFQTKTALIALASINALTYHYASRSLGGPEMVPLIVRRVFAVCAMITWTAVIIAGRWIAF